MSEDLYIFFVPFPPPLSSSSSFLFPSKLDFYFESALKINTAGSQRASASRPTSHEDGANLSPWAARRLATSSFAPCLSPSATATRRRGRG